MLRLSVPAAAVPGDTLLFSKGLKQEWTYGLGWVRETQAEPGNILDFLFIAKIKRRQEWTCQIQRQHWDLRAPPPIAPEEDVRRHVVLQQALWANSGYWSSKIQRASLNMLDVAGVIATEAIAEGELLVRCPSTHFLSPGLVRQLEPDFATLAAVVGREAPVDNQDIDVFLVAMFLADLLATCTQEVPLTGLDGARGTILSSFAKVLQCETFTEHPYRLAATDPVRFRSSLNPSCEADLIERLAWGVMERYRILSSHKTPGYSAEDFLRAWLLVITRAFEVGGARSTLIPGLDSFNHDPSKQCAKVPYWWLVW